MIENRARSWWGNTGMTSAGRTLFLLIALIIMSCRIVAIWHRRNGVGGNGRST